jgi:hypothetical protein
MNAAQTNLMRWLDSEWAKCEKAAGRPYDRDARLAFYGKVTGRTITSSKDLKNDDITDIKRRVLAMAQPANFKAQMKSQEDNDPAAVRARYQTRIEAAVAVLKPVSDYAEPRHAEAARQGCADGTAVNMYGKTVADLDLDQLRKLTNSLEKRARAKQARDQAKPADEDGDPF